MSTGFQYCWYSHWYWYRYYLRTLVGPYPGRTYRYWYQVLVCTYIYLRGGTGTSFTSYVVVPVGLPLPCKV